MNKRSRGRMPHSVRSIALAMLLLLATACSGSVASPPPSQIVDPTPADSATPSPTSIATPIASPSPVGLILARVDVPRATGTLADATSAADAINAFALDLHRRLAVGDENVVFSPASIAIALGMARAGARGQTAEEMDDVLYGVGSDEHAAWLNALDAVLATRTGTIEDDEGTAHELVLDIANSYFAQRDLTFEDAFLRALAERFDAGVYQVDYKSDAEAARLLINGWADEKTRGRIPEVLQPGDVTGDTRLALVNAVYLKAPWERPFDPEKTVDESFTRLDGSTVDVPMMTAFGFAGCAEGDGWVAAELPYLHNKLAMLVIVPDDIAAFEAGLDPAVLAGVDKAIAETVAVSMMTIPKWDTETREELGTMLGALGMPSALDAATADFSGMTTEEALFISKVIHQANISVDEKGTEAAAVTVVGMDTGGGPSKTCTARADRPFLYAIRDTETGAILFMGRVVDPSAT